MLCLTDARPHRNEGELTATRFAFKKSYNKKRLTFWRDCGITWIGCNYKLEQPRPYDWAKIIQLNFLRTQQGNRDFTTTPATWSIVITRQQGVVKGVYSWWKCGGLPTRWSRILDSSIHFNTCIVITSLWFWKLYHVYSQLIIGWYHIHAHILLLLDT